MKAFEPILRAAARNSDYKPDLAFFCEIWPAVMPQAFVSHSRPCGWDGHALHVEVSEDWLLEFQHHRRELLVRLRNIIPWEVDALEFVASVGNTKALQAQAPSPIAPKSGDAIVTVPDLGDEQLNRLASSIARFVAKKNGREDENS